MSKAFILSACATALLVLCLEPLAFAGGMEGGGGDTFLDDTDSAWFLGSQPIRYCLVGGEAEIGVPQAQVQSMIGEAFSKWKSYIDYKGVMRGYEDKPEMVLDLNAQPMSQCDGTEDLKFYLGVEDGPVTEAKKSYNGPAAFSHRDRYDAAKGWGQGFIWIAKPHTLMDGPYPDWKDNPDTLFAMILHEIGHVLGNTHVQDTVMDEDIASLVLFGFTDSKNFRRIDWGAELAENRYFHPLFGGMSADPKNTDLAASFKRIVGRDPSGEVKVTLIIYTGWSAPVDLVFQDALGSKRVTVQLSDEDNLSFIRLPNPIFKRACMASACQGAAYQRLHAGYSMGTISAADGTVLPAFLEFNLGRSSSRVDAPVSVKFWENGKKHDLFAQTELQ
jgi:hypothetical protein